MTQIIRGTGHTRKRRGEREKDRLATGAPQLQRMLCPRARQVRLLKKFLPTMKFKHQQMVYKESKDKAAKARRAAVSASASVRPLTLNGAAKSQPALVQHLAGFAHNRGLRRGSRAQRAGATHAGIPRW